MSRVGPLPVGPPSDHHSIQAVSLLRRYWLPTEVPHVAVLRSAGGKACPAKCGDADLLHSLLQAHVAPAEPVSIHYFTRKNPDGWTETQSNPLVGVYTPLADDTCPWACFDVDGAGDEHKRGVADAEAAARALLAAATRNEVPLVVESSKSANGYHLWLLIDPPAPRADIRAIMFHVWNAARNDSPDAFLLAPPSDEQKAGPGFDPSVTHADATSNRGVEVFPKLKRARPNSFGNLVWLPFWAGARERGGSVLLDGTTFESLDVTQVETLPTLSREGVDRLMAEVRSERAQAGGKTRSAGQELVTAPAVPSVPVTRVRPRARAYIAKCPLAIEGQGGDEATFKVCCALVRGFDLGVEDALAILTEAGGWNEKCSPPWSRDELRAKLLNASEYGQGAPGYLLQARSDDGDGDEPPFGDQFGSELWFARHLVADHGRDLRYVDPWRKWVAWDGRRWRIDDSGEVMRRAKTVARRRMKEAQEELIAALDSGVDDLIKAAKFKVFQVARFWNHTPLQNAIKLAASEAEIAASVNDWDTDPWLLNVGNGTVELQSGKLRLHRRGDLITKLVPVDFDPGASAPQFHKFLRRVLPDAKTRDYVQRAIGYSATGAIREHLLHVAWGSGANGKSTFFEALAHVLDDYAGVAPPALLLVSKSDRHPTELASLFGQRLVTASETPQGGRLNENLMKSLTGGDTIKARRMREDFWEFEPTHKLWLATNHKPRVMGTDLGVWRRLRLVPFTVTIPEDERDADLPRKLRDEASGILAWLVEGCLRYGREGLTAPDAVQVATAEYRDREDVLGEFLGDCIETTADASDSVTAKAMYDTYTDWCDAQGTRPWGQRTVTTRLVERGIQDRRRSSGRIWIGVRIRGVFPNVTSGINLKYSSTRGSNTASVVPKCTPSDVSPYSSAEDPSSPQNGRAVDDPANLEWQGCDDPATTALDPEFTAPAAHPGDPHASAPDLGEEWGEV